ncbi:MAG: DUF3857 domain-containing protein [Bacteroidetes bacterium]|nr:DUF3857 domain-containing protein [Bacteroidota bacterium]
MRPYITTLILTALLTQFIPCLSQERTSDAVYLSLIKEYQLYADGSMDYRQYKKLKLLTYNAIHRSYGETFIVYNPAFQKLKINDAYTIMADSKKIVTPENAFNEVLPGFAANAPFYNGLREMVVTHTGLELGAVIHLDHTITSDAGFCPYLMGNEVLTTSSPIDNLTFIIRVPRNVELKYKVFNISAVPVVTEKDEMKVYTWTFKSLQAQTGDVRQPDSQENQPRIVFSTAPSMQHAIDYLVSQEAFKYKPDSKMEEFVAMIRKEGKSEIETLLRLQDIVVNDLTTNSIPAAYIGFRARPATDTWNSNGGTELEKVILLRALLLKAGINTFPVAVIPASLYNKEIGSLPQIEHFILQVNPREQSQLYLSPVQLDECSLSYDLTDKILLLIDPNIESLKTFSVNEEKNRMVSDWRITINPDNRLTGEVSLELFGTCNPYLALKRDINTSKQFLNPDFSLEDIKVFKCEGISALKSEFKYTLEKVNPFSTKANYLFWNLPAANKGIKSWDINYMNESREVPVELPYSIEENDHYVIYLPSDYTLATPDTRLTIMNSAGQVKIEIKENGQIIDITRSIIITEKTFYPAQYKDLRLLINSWNNKNYTRMIFKNNL